MRKPVAVVCLLYLGLLVVVAIAAPVIWPHIANQQAGDLLAVRQGPSAHHLLGTDNLGRDVLQRLLVGSRVTVVGIVEAVAVLLVVGLPLGLWAGFVGGWIDRLVGWLADLTFSVPAIIVIVVVLSVFPKSMAAAMVTFGLLAAPGLMRVVRASTLAVREELFVAAAYVSGLSRAAIVRRHVLPRIAGVVIIQAALIAAIALLVQSGLSFLQLIVNAPAPSWGGMITDGVGVLELQPWLIVPPGVAIGITVIALGLLGDTVRDATTERWAPPARRRSRVPSAPAASATLVEVDNSLLVVDHLDVAFATQRGVQRVVDDVSFDVRSGETVGLVGESGCGKTMTALAILGLLPGSGYIEEGRIAFAGRDLTTLSDRQLRQVRGKSIGFVSQEPMVALDPAFRVGWQLSEAVRRHQGVSKSVARRKVSELLELVRLSQQVARRYPHQLSGGMAQRVSIARALAGEPELLIADEPTTALDVTVQSEILDLLRRIQEERQMAMLLVTHDWGVVADMCERVVVMYAGQVVERAEVTPMFRETLHPYTEALLASNPHGAAAGQNLPTIEGSVPSPGSWPAGCRFADRCHYKQDDCLRMEIPLASIDGRQTRCIHTELLREGAAS